MNRIRTPLTASLGYMQMIEKSGELSEKNSEYLRIAMQKNQYLKELSDEFFELTKLESNDAKLSIETVSLSNVLTEMILEQHSWIEERGIRTEFDIQDGILIQTDARCIMRILNNLMSNAQKYTADCFKVTLRNGNGRINLSVSNSLSDSEALDINKVFEPFYRISSRTVNGSGLGLYVVKLLCDRLSFGVTAGLDDNIFSVEIQIYDA